VRAAVTPSGHTLEVGDREDEAGEWDTCHLDDHRGTEMSPWRPSIRFSRPTCRIRRSPFTLKVAMNGAALKVATNGASAWPPLVQEVPPAVSVPPMPAAG
jgi:hypothetical protein